MRTNIVILDACRNNPMAGSSQRPSARDVASKLGTRAGCAFGARRRRDVRRRYAHRVRDRAGTGRARWRRREQPVLRRRCRALEVQQMLTRVRAEVVAATKNKQVPWSNSSLLGEVYLAEK